MSDDRVEIGSNIVERAIRPQAITRKTVPRWQWRRRQTLRDNRDAADCNDEFRRSPSLVDADARAHRKRMA